MKKKTTIILLLVAIGISIFFHFFLINKVPPCLNADEAAFSYNAYSILKTGRDEYGSFIPLRFKSFEDFKLPVYTYLSVPFVYVFGLNEFSARALNILIGILFVPLMYLTVKELFGKKEVGLISAFLTAFTPWIYILSRHAHEGVPAAFFTLLSFYFLIKFQNTKIIGNFFFSLISAFLTAFSYHTGRMYLIIFVIANLFVLFKDKKYFKLNLKLIIISVFSLFILLFPFYADLKYGVNRVNSLLFINNQGFQLRLDEYLREQNFRLLHNKLTEAVKDVSNRYFAQISPEFLVIHGDTNLRFGFQNLGLLTPAEYFLIFIGLYFLFKEKQRFRYLIIFLLLISALPNALTWQDMSIIRTYFMIFPLIIIISYGTYHLLESVPSDRLKYAFIFLGVGTYLFFLIYSWDIYFFHYPKRAEVVRAWQCGYKEISQYVKDNYNKYDNFVITSKNGQPYIFLLFYLNYNPAIYQRQAKISGPDGYGFGQVEKFDKFNFQFKYDPLLKKTSFIGYSDDFENTNIDLNKVKKIKVRTEEIYWIFENN